MKTTNRGFWALMLITTVALLAFSQPIRAQYLGATFGFNYDNDMAGPDNKAGSQPVLNVPLYNPDPNNTQASWDNWVREAGQAGLDFICPNLRGSSPISGWSPAGMAPVITALNNSGFSGQLKICAFDDNASSWTAQINDNKSSTPFDISNPANWTYIYDTNYKVFLQTVPDQYRFKIDGRPVYIVWTGNPHFISNEQGNYSRAMTYLRQQSEADFGVNPYIIVGGDAIANDTTLAAVVDGVHSWNSENPKGWSLTSFNGNTNIGVAEAGLRAPGASDYEDPNHGTLLQTNLSKTVNGATLTLMEGFMDWEENAALFRMNNLSSSGAALDYSNTLYDYPNQRLDIIRQHSRAPFPVKLLLEAEGADNYGGANGGNGKTNFYRNGNIAIEVTSDTGGGFDVGWMQPGEWLEWESVPLNGTPHFLMRIATPNSGVTAHFVIDGVAEPSQTLPNTGGYQNWTTYDFGAYGTYSNSNHVIRLVFDNGGENINWWEVSQGPQIAAGATAVDGTWVADTDYSGSTGTYTTTASINTANVSYPAPLAVYQSERSGAMTYTIPNLIANANYTVDLHFAEIYFTAAGKRQFNVLINGTQVLTNFDIFAAAGGENIAIVKSFPATANASGQITIQFTNGAANNPKVSGIEIVPSSTDAAFYVNSGGSGSGDFVADTDYSGGTGDSTTNTINLAYVKNPAPEAVYQSERYGEFTYTVSNLKPGPHSIRLHFAEFYFTQIGQRVFNVSINGTQALTNFDIIAATGQNPNTAIVEEFTAAPDANGQIAIQFTNGPANNPKVSGIEVH